MSDKRTVVPEARMALNEFKAEIAQEFGIHSKNYESLANAHTGRLTRKLVEMGKNALHRKRK